MITTNTSTTGTRNIKNTAFPRSTTWTAAAQKANPRPDRDNRQTGTTRGSYRQQGHHPQSAIVSRATQHSNHTTAPTQAEIEHAFELADVALGAAGHEVTDQDTRGLGRQTAAGAITVHEAAARLVANLRSRSLDQPF